MAVYFVQCDAIDAPADADKEPRAVFVLYAEDKAGVIKRENVPIPVFASDAELKEAMDDWAAPHIAKFEKNKGVSDFANKSAIIGARLEYGVPVEAPV